MMNSVKKQFNKYNFDSEVKLEVKLWRAFSYLDLGEPQYHKAFMYLQYAIMMEQREQFSDDQIQLTFKERKAKWYALKKLLRIARQGTLDSINDLIREHWHNYNQNRKWYWYKKDHTKKHPKSVYDQPTYD